MKIVTLEEYIHPQMDILFVALNAPEISNRNAHWFSRSLNFWNILYDAGLIKKRIHDPLNGDKTVFGGQNTNQNNRVYGVTDLVRDIVQTKSAAVKTRNEHVQHILAILDKNFTKKVCLMHSAVASQFEKSGIIKRNYLSGENIYGLVGNYNNTEIYEVPFHNAMIKRDVKLKAYGQLNGNPFKNKNPETTIKEQKTTPQDNSNVKGKVCFILPEPGNSITQGDIDKGTLRITAGAKIYFPKVVTTIKVVVRGKIFNATYTARESRSGLLRIGREATGFLELKAGGRVKISKVNDQSFRIEKA